MLLRGETGTRFYDTCIPSLRGGWTGGFLGRGETTQWEGIIALIARECKRQGSSVMSSVWDARLLRHELLPHSSQTRAWE